VPALARDRVRASGDQPFLTFYDDRTGERTELGHATFDNWVAKTANLLVDELEVRRGDSVGLVLGSHWTTVAVAFACWRVGAAAVPLDPAAGAAELGRALAAVGARSAFVGEDTAAPDPDASTASWPGSRAPARGLDDHVLQFVRIGAGPGGRASDPGAAGDGALGYGEEVLAFGDDYDDPGVGAGDDALLVATARSWVRLTQGNLLAAAAGLADWGVDAGDRVLVAQSTQAVDGLALGLLGPFLAGASVVLVRGLDPAGFWAKAVAERATLALVPAEVLAVLPPPERTHGVRHLLVPAGAGRDAVAAAAARTGVPVAPGHGVVAATCASSLVPADAGPAARDWLARYAAPTVGTPLAGTELTVQALDGTHLAEGDRGELCVRGPVVTPDAGADWLHTGDEGFVETGPDGRPWAFVTGDMGPEHVAV